MKPTPQFSRKAVESAIIVEPFTTYAVLAERFGISESMVKTIAKQAGLSRPRGQGAPSWKLRPGSKVGRKAVTRG